MRLRKERIIIFGIVSFVILFLLRIGHYFDRYLMSGNVFGPHTKEVFSHPGSKYVISSNVKNAIISKNDTVHLATIPNINNFPEITVVTSYVNIGKFQKGSTKVFYTPDTYMIWMKTWNMLTNNVIGFFDEDETLDYFRKIRSSQPADKSVLLKINRTDLSSFNKLDKIRQIFQTPGYPKHPPNTVVAEYSCAMHAKYDALQMALSKGLVKTKYVAWLDIGLFRHLIRNATYAGDPITLEVPDTFNSSCIGMSEVKSRSRLSNVSPREYIWKNIVWVGGGFVLGTRENMWTFTESYKLTLNELLEQNLTSTDQQVIGAMYSPEYINRQKVDMMAYRCKDGQFGLYGTDVTYFCLAYVCKDAGDRQREAERNGHV